MSIFYSGSLISGAFGNLIAAGILNGLAGAHGYSAWQWLYILEGSITVFIGIMVVFILPDFPETWRLLAPEMKTVAKRRMAIDAAEADIDGGGGMSQLAGLKLAMTDPKTHILALAYMCIGAGAGFANFFPTLTATLHYNYVISLLLCAPPYVFIFFISLAHSWMSDRVGNRFWFFVYPIPLTIAGWVIFMSTENFAARYFSFFLMVMIFAMNGTCYAWIANSIPRPPAKRAAAYAYINSIANSASIWSPYTFRTQDAPFYRPGLGIAIGIQCVAFFCALALRVLLARQNKELDRLENEDVELDEEQMERLSRLAEIQGIDTAEARSLQKSFRYII